ncbi:MAG TPA: T9SS type A sorting domain-containing protein [Ignavibacteriaceae bacterium]|nr:T9SS type A sorting domain-containing protein [Ignavibacteriaceae bacterium]
MIKKLSVLFIALAIFSFAFAQDRNVVEVKRMVPDANLQVKQGPSTILEKLTAIGETFIITDYDYGGNNVIPKMIDLADIDGDGTLNPFFTAMERDLAVNSNRRVMFGYSAFGAPIDVFNAFDPTVANYGWGTLQYCVGGPLDGNALIMAHSGGVSHHSIIDLVNLQPVSPLPTTTFGDNFPDFYYHTDGTIWTLNTTPTIRRSTDGGNSFDSIAVIGAGDPNVNLAAGGPSENPLYGAAGGQFMATIGAWVTMTPDTNDGVYWYGTTDFGATWFGITIAEDGVYGQVANNPNLAPYFENFGQLNANISENGVTHVVMNGYGEGINTAGDTVNAFPLVYWNSDLGQWYDIGVPEVAFEPNSIMADFRPGNGIGQAYPSVSVSDDGQVVFVIWTAPEYSGAVGGSTINTYTGTSTTSFYTDLHWAVSTDAGVTFTAPQVIGEQLTSETYANVARRLELVPNGNMLDVVAHFVFFVDAIPGTSLFTGDDNALGTWQYLSAVVTQIPTSVENPGVVSSFNLEQNYPNPFNPSTTIKYSVAERSNVAIKVYDMLGKEVASLVNTVKDAGSYEVDFSAQNLASGMYVYSITAGNFTSSKKMMLL